ncbi:cob(I)alamin adenolsyltransferase/cobinamide ATP-dependent adenolsyltransferase [Vibrio parahaemolyticus]|uniref:cob(I)alamin adenolsyltransferase/cobinamide ATP-dependent adenolsyltransferase n=1 Tax=Vibrio parahaemolyticus TaxID=670 RepID=UPI0003E21C4C|nr:cob(I)alamin adenolsyltransferase/cobinamide ATP-dependent adenolsyltransferase [Vibrio parahaemolyticus]EGR0032807.1 triacylglycerol lipase [Vibrio parahaemolyticus]EGR0201107.1 triacylglycerol lipase [Vibrio parahaemolyticus]EGR2289980.1 triacylglycerol lipase [Vibrio parahaemolyticus]EGR9080167.1 triacylglycerol lipase [Vibrio parahaemolyticus]EHS1220853.1 triacylglycerol lipase [Vibrio parahaemolyticus]
MKIIILHGLYMHGLVMQPLSQKLRKLGYETQVLSYNTVAIDESSLFDSIDHSLNPLTANVLVGHSLGGLMIKRYLANRKPTTSLISHVVAIGSPLKGASIVGRIQDLGLGAILGNSPHHGLNKHDDAWAFPQKLGSIAGTVPICARPLLIRNDNTMSDGTVTVEETRLDGMQDHIEVKQTHTSLIYNTFVPQQIDHFIRRDYFRR